MSVAPSITCPLVAISPSARMKNPVPMPRTGGSAGPPLPWPYIRSRNSRNGSLLLPCAVVATIPTTAGIDDFTSAAIDAGGPVGRSLTVGASIQSGLAASSSASASVMRANVGTLACRGNECRLLLDHRSDELLRRRICRAGRALAVQEHAELVLGGWVLRRRAADLDVAEKLRDDLAGALRIAFVARGQRVEDRLVSSRLPGHGGGDRLLGVAGVEAALQPGEGE